MNQSSQKRRTYDVIVTREVLGIQHKPKKRRRAFPRARLLSVPLLAGLAGALFQLLTAPAYRVHGAAVQGNTLVGAQAIYQMSMLEGQNLFLLNTQAAAEAVERLPYVKRAWLHVRPPAQVAIIVEEYQPRWTWIAGENRFWIDQGGKILPYNGPLDGALTVVDPSGRPLPLGSSLEPRLVETMDGLSQLMSDTFASPSIEPALSLSKGSGLRLSIGLEQVMYDENMGFILNVGPGWPARIGDGPDQLAIKIGILNSLLPELLQQNQDVDFIDLRYPEQPYYRLK